MDSNRGASNSESIPVHPYSGQQLASPLSSPCSVNVAARAESQHLRGALSQTLKSVPGTDLAGVTRCNDLDDAAFLVWRALGSNGKAKYVLISRKVYGGNLRAWAQEFRQRYNRLTKTEGP